LTTPALLSVRNSSCCSAQRFSDWKINQSSVIDWQACAAFGLPLMINHPCDFRISKPFGSSALMLD
jgi:hypothetical protein